VNDAPVITAGSILNYSENDPAAVIDGGLSISDIDDTHIESATVTISTNYINAEDVLAFVDTANITGSFNSATGVLTLTGSDTVVNYQNALQSITYMNTSDNPSMLSRTVSWVVNDGDSNSVAVTSTVTINAGNDLPTAANSNVSTLKDSTYTFNINDFNYTDPDADIIASITVTSLEGVGSLKLNNNDVVANQVISKAAIDAGLLTFTPVSGQDGIGYDSFEFSVNDGQSDSLLSYVMTIDVQIAGDINGNGVIDVPGEIAGDINGNGVIDDPDEVAGDINGNGQIDDPDEVAGDINGNGQIDDPDEVAGDINGNGQIDDPDEVAGDINGNGQIDDPDEVAGDVNGNGQIDDPDEVAGDINGNGQIDDPDEVAGDINGNGQIDDPDEVAGDVNGNGQIDDPDEVAGDINGNGQIDDPDEVAGDINGNGQIDDPDEVAGDINGNGTLDFPSEIQGLIDSINFYYEPVYQLITQDTVSGNYLITGSAANNVQREVIPNSNQVVAPNTALSGFINNSILDVFIPNFTSGSGSVDSPLVNETLSNQSVKVGSVLSSDYIDVVIKGLETDNGTISVIRDGNRVDIYYEPESSFSGVADFALEIYQNKVLSDVKHFEITVNQNVDIIHENNMRQTETTVKHEGSMLEENSTSPEIEYKQTDLAIEVSDVDHARTQSILNEFGKALDDRAPISTLSDIASTAVKDALNTYSISETSSIVKGLLKQAIDAGESTVRIAAIASSMLDVSRESSYGSDVVIRNIIQQTVDSGLSTDQIAQILSTMLLNTDDQYRDDFIVSIVSESNVTDLHLYQMKQILEQQDPELSDKLSKEMQMIRGNQLSTAFDANESQNNNSSKGLLAKLKDTFLGKRQTQNDEMTDYDINEHKYKIELAKAEILTMVRNESVNNNEEHKKR
ncbi:Ig-like domain-containing protein, partial [Cysteiniphilum sp. 19X3-34]|uniref:Ig-like domain-containing protein n=1 Tax=Cysteiniphilum sp. 19X3-34 TaxID=2775040 RepID=UPI00193AD75E